MVWRNGGWVCAFALAWPGAAAASPVVIPLDGEADLIEQGFEHHADGGVSTFADGMMTVDTVGFEEWILFAPTDSKWWREVRPEKGWWIEVRMRVEVAASDCINGGPGLWIHDRGELVRIFFGSDRVYGPAGASAPFDTSALHVYRVERLGDGTRRLLADGAPLLDLAGPDGDGGTLALSFGDLGGCAHSRTVWDYYSYDTFAPGQEDGDDDGDGIANADDDCFANADADQADDDGDGRGNACDPCPRDGSDDRDHDGACDSDDACPDDASATQAPCPMMDTGMLDGLEAGLEAGWNSAGPDAAGGADGCGCTARGPGGGWLALLAVPCWFRRRRAATHVTSAATALQGGSGRPATA